MEFKQYFMGICITIVTFVIVFSFRFFELLALIKVIIACSVLTLVYFIIKRGSAKNSLHFSQQFSNRTPKDLSYKDGKISKKKFSLKQLIKSKIYIVFLFFSFYYYLGMLIGNLRIFLHEIGHLIVALSFNITILHVYVSTLLGYVEVDGIIPLGQLNLLTISGTLWIVIVGIIFLIALYRDKKLPFTINVSLSVIIWIELTLDMYYWFTGSISRIGDPLVLINSNPGLNPLVITYGSLIILIILCILAFLYLRFKIYPKFKILKSRIERSKSEDTQP